MSNTIVTIRDLRRKSPKELEKLLLQLHDQMSDMQFELRIGHVRKVHGAGQLRKSIAKVLTIQHEQKHAATKTSVTKTIASAKPMPVAASAKSTFKKKS